MNVNEHIDLPASVGNGLFCLRRPPAPVGAALPQGLPGVVGPQLIGAGETVPAGGAEGQRFALLDLIALGPHPRKKIIVVPAVGEYPVNGLAQMLLVAAPMPDRLHLLLLPLFFTRLRVLDHGQAVRPAQIVIEPPENQVRILGVYKFSVTVEVGAVKFYVRVNMGLVHMGGHNKLVFPLREFHRQLIADPVGFFRADLSWFEGLNDPVHDNVPVDGLAPSGDLEVKPLAKFKFFGGGFRGTHERGHQLAVLGFLRFLVIVVPVRHGLLPGPVPHNLPGEYVGDCHLFLLSKQAMYSLNSSTGSLLLQEYFSMLKEKR